MPRKRKRPRRGWATGSVYERRSDSRWVAAIRGADGKRQVRYYRSESEALEALADMRANAGKPRREWTVGRQLIAWLEEKRATVRRSSWERYEEHVRLHLADLAPIRLADLQAEDVREQVRRLSERGASPASIAGILTTLRAALELAVSDGTIARNVARHVRAPAQEDDPGAEALTADEARRILAVDSPYRPLWAVLLGTGIRRGEALGLRWTDVGHDTITIEQSIRRGLAGPTKSRAGRRTVAMPAFVRAALDSLPRDAILVFHRPDGRPLAQSTVAWHWAQTCRAAGLPPTRLHNLRHTAATILLSTGASLDDVKRMLGHSSIAVTSDIYGHRSEERSRELAHRLDEAVQ